MKRLTILICVLAMLLALAGVASASPKQPRKFRIEGYTSEFDIDWFQTEPPCTVTVWSDGEVIRDIQGTFDMEEQLHFSQDCYSVFQQFMAGNMPLPDYNEATLTIWPDEGGEVHIDFMGHTSEKTVWGAFWVNSGTGFYEGLAGGGTHKGIPDTCTMTLECTGFYVTFTGRFDTVEGKNVFDGHKKAVKELMKIRDSKEAGENVKGAAMAAIIELLTADESLASTAIQEAIEAAKQGGCPVGSSDHECKKVLQEIGKAQDEMGKATKERDKGKYDKAIDHYKKAWEHAQKAIKKAS